MESCNSTWIFEESKRRFRRVPRGTAVDLPAPATEWTEYHEVVFEADGESFVVSLNEEGTRLLRSFRHHEPCSQCGEQPTTELRLADIERTP